ncbi:hypothetical protein OPKNFCMD_1438 [Methylobacterium crusticola]|uniref:Uncharacterized protein n=1 Tax=Methylobacterium crusticola TaxID=1697972 RepID=A0ABQ4QUU0_9HYPH|nr:hypothetical protein [Methylobacterium crusticola]GJD48714.1 hypothetical protein OPKNFCMD_1438 [Methylobacterium crusticola]
MIQGHPTSGAEAERDCPVPLTTLGAIYRADPEDLPDLLAKLPAPTRAKLAAYLYAKSHTHTLGLTVARTCEKDDLVKAAGEIGAVIHGQAHLPPTKPAAAAPAAPQTRKISLGGSAAKGRSFD